MKVLVLGERGMLGNTVLKYFNSKNSCEVQTIIGRWDSKEFKKSIRCFTNGFIINCIGAIPQKTNHFVVNTELPMWLVKNSMCRIVHPGTDCELDNDLYGISKREATEFIVEKRENTKVIKSSIIGHEDNGVHGLLEWFLTLKEMSVVGYGEWYWNGITTLQWAKVCYNICRNWEEYSYLTIPYTECISKYKLLQIINDVYKKEIIINKSNFPQANKCLKGNLPTPTIKEQLLELQSFFRRR